MWRYYFGLLLVIEVFSLKQSSGSETNKFKGQSLLNEFNETSSIQGSEIRGASVQVKDIWSMIASLGGGIDTNQADYSGGNLYTSKQFKSDWRLRLDQTNGYELEWSVDYGSNKIEFALNINKTESNFRFGFDIFALGFSDYGSLNSSDYCIIWHDLSHRIHVQDARTSISNRLELLDEEKSYCKLLGISGSIRHQHEDHLNLKSGELDVDQVQSRARSKFRHSNLTQIIFRRPLDTCTSGHYTIDNGTTHLVWFTIRGPVLSIDGLNLSELISLQQSGRGKQDDGRVVHQFESGMKRVQLIATKPTLYIKNKTLIHDVRMENFAIPASETTYWCKLLKLPHRFESKRYHITKYESIIKKSNEHVVHHMELFNCADLSSEQETDLSQLYEGGGWAGDCNGKTRPKATEPCRRVILAWAMGAKPLEYPEQVGQSIGGHNYSPYVVLEVHYNNVASSDGLVDDSGLRFHYTSRLRPFDAGILEVGLEYTDKNSVPPSMLTPIAGHCVSECTRAAMSSYVSSSNGRGDASLQAMDRDGKANQHHLGGDESNNSKDQGIYIFAAQMHTHLVGVASWTEHIRGGKLLRELQRDNHYSPHFQEIRLLPEPVRIEPGDALVHYCLYDTRNRVNITLGGFSTSDEMCVTYLHYYPKIDLEVCKSSVDTRALASYFSSLAREEDQQTSTKLIELESEFVKAKSIGQNYRSIVWTPKRSRELIQFYAQAPLSVQCNRSNGDRYPGYWTGIPPTRLWPIETSGDYTMETPYSCSELRSGKQLVKYRGREFGRRHAQCNHLGGAEFTDLDGALNISETDSAMQLVGDNVHYYH